MGDEFLIEQASRTFVEEGKAFASAKNASERQRALLSIRSAIDAVNPVVSREFQREMVERLNGGDGELTIEKVGQDDGLRLRGSLFGEDPEAPSSKHDRFLQPKSGPLFPSEKEFLTPRYGLDEFRIGGDEEREFKWPWEDKPRF